MSHTQPPTAVDPRRDDRVLLVTRLVHGLLVVIVVPFFIGLTFYPEHTDTNFAWPLVPRMSAMFFGSLYLAVIYSFARAALARQWHHVGLLMWATIPVVAMLGAVTLLHWDKFGHGLLAFQVWLAVYVFSPPLLVFVLLVNRRRDPRVPDRHDVVIPLGVRRGTAILGLLFAGVGAALLLFPEAMMGVWPWPLKPLSSRGIGCMFIAPAVTHLIALRDSRWSSLKIATEAALLWFTAIAVAVVRCWSDFDTSRPLTWVFLFVLGVEWAFTLWSYVTLEGARRRLSNRAA